MDFLDIALIILIVVNFVQLVCVLWLVRDVRALEGYILDVGITLAKLRHPATRSRSGPDNDPDGPIDLPRRPLW